MFLVAGFLLAARLEPSPNGLGTHHQLGLPACSFRRACGVPCPSCGMTTSFSHFVRGHIFQAARVNFAGLVLAIICVWQVFWSGRIAWTGRYPYVYRFDEILISISLLIAGIALVQWILNGWLWRMIFSE